MYFTGNLLVGLIGFALLLAAGNWQYGFKSN